MDVKALREEFSKVQSDAQALISAAATANRDLTAEEQEQNDKRFARLEQIKKQFDEQAKFARLALDAGVVTTAAAIPGQAEHDAAEGRARKFTKADGSFDLNAYCVALNTFARTGDTRQLYTITTGTQGGAYLPKEVLQPVTVRRLRNAWRGVLDAYGYMPIETDSLATFSLPVANDNANIGEVLSESAASGTSTDPDNTGAISFSPSLFSSDQFWYSNSMVLGTTSFDVTTYTLEMAQKRIDKNQESAWTNKAMAGTVGLTTASATAITYTELLNWEHSLAAAYRTDAVFVVSDSLYRALRGLVDNNNRPIIDLDPQSVFAGKMHGKPIIVCDYLQTLAANHICGAFVSADAVKIVDITNARLARYVNYPGKPDQVGYEMFQNADAGFVGPGLSLLKTAIS